MTEEEERYKLYGIPGPSQYKAFSEFFNFFSENEFEFKERNIFCYYDIAKMEKMAELSNTDALSEICVLKYIDNLTNFDFSGQKQKKIVYSSGYSGKKYRLSAQRLFHNYSFSNKKALMFKSLRTRKQRKNTWTESAIWPKKPNPVSA